MFRGSFQIPNLTVSSFLLFKGPAFEELDPGLYTRVSNWHMTPVHNTILDVYLVRMGKLQAKSPLQNLFLKCTVQLCCLD